MDLDYKYMAQMTALELIEIEERLTRERNKVSALLHTLIGIKVISVEQYAEKLQEVQSFSYSVK